MKFKKVLSLILVLLFVLASFYGCKNTTSNDEEISSIISFEEAYSEAVEEQKNQDQEDIIQENEDGSKSIIYANPTTITENVFYLSGKKIQLPVTYKEFANETGYKYTDNSLAQDSVEPQQYYLGLPVTSSAISDKNSEVNIPVINYTDSKTDVENLTVIGIEVYGTDEFDFKLESGLTIGQKATINDVIGIYGTPKSALIDAEGVNGSVEYRYNTDTAYQSLVIHVQNGAIYEISMTIPF